jgi:hypothetical protein
LGFAESCRVHEPISTSQFAAVAALPHEMIRCVFRCKKGLTRRTLWGRVGTMTGWRRPRPLVMPGLQSAASLLNTRMTRPDVIEQPRPKVRRRRRLCLGCPFLAPSGKCLDTRLKSGRCGDWIFYVWGGKQFRHLDVKPHDPRTPSQRCCRNRLTGASRRYSRSLSEAERAACIAAGAKRRSRKRLGQCGRLTGQQHWVGKECARVPEPVGADVQSASKPLETKENSIPAWERHRDTSLTTPYQHRGNASLPVRGETRRPRPEGTGGAWSVLRPAAGVEG